MEELKGERRMCVMEKNYGEGRSIFRAFAWDKDDLYLNGRVNQFRKKNFENNNGRLDDSWHLNNVSVEMEEDVDNL